MVSRIQSARTQVAPRAPKENQRGATSRAPFPPVPPRAPGPTASRDTPREPPLQRVAATIERQRAELDRAIREAARGRSFSPVEILALQARVFAYAQNLEVLSQVVDKSVGAVKTTLNTQL